MSDAHLGSPKSRRSDRDKEAALIDFLHTIKADAEALYLVGDFFDFWFEYRSVVSATSLRILCELYALVQAGIRVIYMPGNHDLWPGHFFSSQLGFELPGDPVTVMHQGKQLYITHGDSFRIDWKYKFSRGLLKHSVSVALFRLLHPDLGAYLARLTSRYSDCQNRVGDLEAVKKARAIYMAGAKKAIQAGMDIVVCGHYHHLKKIEIGKGTLVVLGDWMRYDSYALLEDGKITIHQWKSAPETYRDPLQE